MWKFNQFEGDYLIFLINHRECFCEIKMENSLALKSKRTKLDDDKGLKCRTVENLIADFFQECIMN